MAQKLLNSLLDILWFKGVKYLKAADNTIYDINTHEEIGVWDEIKQEIVEDEE